MPVETTARLNDEYETYSLAIVQSLHEKGEEQLCCAMMQSQDRYINRLRVSFISGMHTARHLMLIVLGNSRNSFRRIR
jgi:hypothetical protein